MLNVAAPVLADVVIVKLAGRPLPPVVVNVKVPSPPTVFFTILIWVAIAEVMKLLFCAPPLVPDPVSTPTRLMWIGAPAKKADPFPVPQPPAELPADDARWPVQPSITLHPAIGHAATVNLNANSRLVSPVVPTVTVPFCFTKPS